MYSTACIVIHQNHVWTIMLTFCFNNDVIDVMEGCDSLGEYCISWSFQQINISSVLDSSMKSSISAKK